MTVKAKKRKEQRSFRLVAIAAAAMAAIFLSWVGFGLEIGRASCRERV